MKDRKLQERFRSMLSWFGYAADTAGPELADLLNDTRAQGREEGAAIVAGVIGMGEAIARRQMPAAAAFGLFDIAREAIDLVRSGYDGPFMGEEVAPLFRSVAKLESMTQANAADIAKGLGTERSHG